MAPTKQQKTQASPSSPVINQIVIRPPYRKASDVSTWRTALQSADLGRMKMLFDLYEDLLIDGVLADAIDKRISAVTNSPITFQDASGKEVEELEDVIDTPAFEELLTTIMQSRFWGRAGGEFNFANGIEFIPIPPKHIKLENQTILINEYDDTGVDYTADDYLLVLGRKADFGLFLKTAPYAIWKRGGFGDYAQWLELFGMPQRVGKYSSYDPESRKTLVQAMEQAGAAPWIVIPKETDVETTNNTGTSGSGSAHNDFRKACNEELLITILGQTMTTLDGASRAQSYTHKKVEEGKNRADMRYVRRILNTQVVPILEKRGYPVAGGKFIFPEDSEVLAVADMVSICGLIDVPDSYLRNKYSIPVPENGEVVARSGQNTTASPDPSAGGEAGKPAPDKGAAADKANTELSDGHHPPEGISFWKGLRDFFVAAPQVGAIRNLFLSDPNPVGQVVNVDALVNQAIRNIYRTKTGSDNPAGINNKLFELTNKPLQNGIESTFKSVGADWGRKNETFVNQFRENTAVFSAFKSHEQTAKMVELMYKADGSIRSFSDFKKEALKLSQDYNKTWLNTEYNTAIRAARMAVNWLKFQETKHLYPNLEYMPSRAAHPRESHADYYYQIWPIDDPIWDSILPPSDWGCLCSVRATDKPPTEQAADWSPPAGNPVFQNNSGKTAKFVNTEATPYYLNTPEEKRPSIILFAMQVNANRAKIEESFSLYEEYLQDKNFKDVQFDNSTGALKATHLLHSFDRQTGKYEVMARDILFERGNSVVLLSEQAGIGVKTPDGLLNGSIFDIKAVIGQDGKIGNNNLKNKLIEGSAQGCKKVVLIFSNSSLYSGDSQIYNAIARYSFNCGKANIPKNLNEVLVIVDNTIKKFRVEP